MEDDVQTDSSQSASAGMMPVEAELRKQREGLLLQRSQILQQIASARNPRYQELLKEMLRHVESRLSSQ